MLCLAAWFASISFLFLCLFYLRSTRFHILVIIPLFLIFEKLLAPLNLFRCKSLLLRWCRRRRWFLGLLRNSGITLWFLLFLVLLLMLLCLSFMFWAWLRWRWWRRRRWTRRRRFFLSKCLNLSRIVAREIMILLLFLFEAFLTGWTRFWNCLLFLFRLFVFCYWRHWLVLRWRRSSSLLFWFTLFEF